MDCFHLPIAASLETQLLTIEDASFVASVYRRCRSAGCYCNAPFRAIAVQVVPISGKRWLTHLCRVCASFSINQPFEEKRQTLRNV